MTVTPRTLCLWLALLVFAVATFWSPPAPPRFHLVAAGLGLLTLSFLVPG
jgi:hypothetical protein